MNVYLYYVEGISRIDTPYFATKTIQASLSKQEEFFDNHLVKTVELSFYPPHYRNSIRFEEEDLTIMDNVNYLGLEYNGKRYYYFIDSVEYISETLIEVEITMDVIQTYMFDIYISNGIIERKFINRWVSAKINRDYIRENVSNNEYIYYTHEVYNENSATWLVFTPRTRYAHCKETLLNTRYNIDLPGLKSGEFIRSSYVTRISPYVACKFTGQWYWETNAEVATTSAPSSQTDEISISNNCGSFVEDDEVVDMYLCPFAALEKVKFTFDLSDNRYNISFTSGSTEMCVCTYIQQVYSQSYDVNYLLPYNGSYAPHETTLSLKCLTGSQTVGNISANSLISVAYHSKYITQMLDENYIRIKYGSINAYTSIPLYYLETNVIKYYAAFMPTDGSRIYWLTRYTDTSTKDKYNTVTIDTNIIHYDLKNDPWEKYVAANRGRWAAATVNTALSIFTKGMYNAQQNKFAAQEINDIKSNPMSYDRRYKEPKLKNKPGKLVATREREIESNNMSTKMGAIQATQSNLISQAFQDYNVMCQPPDPKQISTMGGVSAKDAYIMYYEEHVQDYEQCAQYYHRNGFLVNEYINAKSDIFGYVFNRYYFNILKMQLPNVHLHNVIEDEDTCDAIADRLVDGIRLWNVNNPGVVIGDFQYDNVENLYVS